jgi:hypothetical protein
MLNAVKSRSAGKTSILLFTISLFTISLFVSSCSDSSNPTNPGNPGIDSAVTLVSPPDNSIFPDTINYIIFKWNKKFNSSSYQLQVSSKSDFSDGWTEIISDTTFISYSYYTLPAFEYWRVRIKDCSQYSPTWKFIHQ